jgi:hypothetical protein
MDAGIAAIAAGAVGGAIGLRAPLASSTLSSRTRRREAAERTYADYLFSTYAVVLALGEVARAQPADKDTIKKALVWPVMSGSNTALTAIELHLGRDCRDAALQFDGTLVELGDRAHDRRYSREQWRELRQRTIAAALTEAQ